MRAEHRHFTTIWEQTVDNSPTDRVSSSFKWWSSRHGVATLYNCWVVLFAISQHFSTHSFASAEILDSNIILLLSTTSLPIWHSLWVQPKKTWSRNDVGSSKSTSFVCSFPHWVNVLFLSKQFYVVHIHRQEWSFFSVTNKHSQFGTFSQPYFNRTFSNCLSHNSPARGSPYRFRSIGRTGSSMLDHDLGHLCRQTYPNIWTFWLWVFFNNVGASSILSWV